MCYICNTKGDSSKEIPAGFGNHFSVALSEMKYAAKCMLIMSQNPNIEYLGEENAKKVSKNYDKMHKKMIRLIREWANIEHERERWK